jgi:hypothetical protein
MRIPFLAWACRETPVGLLDIGRVLLRPLLASALAAALVALVAGPVAAAMASPLGALVVTACVFGLCYLGCMFVFPGGRKFFRGALVTLRSAFAGKRG